MQKKVLKEKNNTIDLFGQQKHGTSFSQKKHTYMPKPDWNGSFI